MDENLLISDFSKTYSQKAASVCYRVVLGVDNKEDDFIAECLKHFDDDEKEKAE